MFLSGCASGIVPIGQDTYMMSDTGAWSWSSGANLKAGIYREAYEFCRQQGKEMMPVNTYQKNANFREFAHAEVQFRCLNKDDPEYRRPTMVKTPDVIIQTQ
jgi:hypothetical protein